MFSAFLKSANARLTLPLLRQTSPRHQTVRIQRIFFHCFCEIRNGLVIIAFVRPGKRSVIQRIRMIGVHLKNFFEDLYRFIVLVNIKPIKALIKQISLSKFMLQIP